MAEVPLGYGEYVLEQAPSPFSTLRNYFDALEGKLEIKNIRMNAVTSEIVNLPERPEYTPTITLFQLKALPDSSHYIFREELFVHNEFLSSFEQFLRGNAQEVPALFDATRPFLPEFAHYYDTPYSLIVCDVERIIMTMHKPTGKFGVIEHVGELEIFRGVDTSALMTLRMIEPICMEEKLREIEKKANYVVTICHAISPAADARLLLQECKIMPYHYLMKRKE